MKKRAFLCVSSLLMVCALITGNVIARKRFEGVILKPLLIGGLSYEYVYEKIPELEKRTGMVVDTSTRLSWYELNKKLNLEIAAGKTDYSVVSMHDEHQVDKVDYFVDLRQYLTVGDAEDFIKPILDASVVKGKLIAIPRFTDARIMFYRTDLFNDPNEKAAFKKKYGYELRPPENWDQLRDIAEFFTRPPHLYGFVFTGRDRALTITFYEFLKAAGGDLVDKNMKPILNETPGIEALTFLVNLYRKWKVTPRGVPTYLWDEETKTFMSGRVAILFDYPPSYGTIGDPDQSKVWNKFDVEVCPKGPGDHITSGGGSHTYSLLKMAKNKDAAWELIHFLTSPEIMYYEAKKTGAVPTRKSVWTKIKEDALKSGNTREIKRLKVLEKTLDAFTHNCIEIPEWPEITDMMWPILQQSLLGEKTPKQALDEIADNMYAILEKAGYYK